MKSMTPENIAKACGGTMINCENILGREVTAVTTDSRTVTKGCLYIPMKGAKFDGHAFIPQVMEGGALLTLTEREDAAEGFACIKVKRTDIAIQRIAEFYRMGLKIPVVGITGSVGKTSTKEMVAAVLSQKYNVLKTAGNFNNNLGLPLTIFRITEEHDIAVLEMGISHFGEMTDLARTARPNTMVITNIGTCHLEYLKDRDGVFEAKTECFEYVDFANGTVVLNGDDDKLCRVDQVHGRAPVFYGMNPRLRVYADNVQPQGLKGTACTINIDDRSFDVTVPVPGRHMVMNALAGAAVGSLYGLTDEEIKAGIESLESLSGRFHIVETDKYTVIDDCYNANPMSMKASLSVLGDAEGKCTAILGDMGELGEDEAALHREVGTYAGGLPIDRFILVGGLSKNIEEGLREEGSRADIRWFDSVEALLPELPSLLVPGDIVLVKASHFMGFDRIVQALV
ncbi:MAG: UDP-N-acetylmuramoyl-tripeptide--D-alanyl-D-alanine ligase [Lachnospiraceae bacterium]|nr:UDP-N-acetylmuramoyl-tripeptide--D-alanyl-D-alanine ligase [Lachnospiraceae bacterium]